MAEIFSEFFQISVLEGIGMIGVALYIGGYFAVQSGFISGDGIGYAAINVAAAFFVGISLIDAFNIASFVIQVCFGTIGIIGIIRKLSQEQRFPGQQNEHLDDPLSLRSNWSIHDSKLY